MQNYASSQTYPPVSDKVLWEGRPSQVVNMDAFGRLGFIAIGIMAAWYFVFHQIADAPRLLALPFIIAIGVCGAMGLKRYLTIRCMKYVITQERLTITTGILSTVTEQVEIRRIQDSSIQKPFSLRTMGLGNILLIDTDPTAPTVTLLAIPHPDDLHDAIRTLVREEQARFGMREVNMISRG